MEKQEWIERYKKVIVKKTGIAEEGALEMARNAFGEFGEDGPEESADSELLQKRWYVIDTN